MASHRSHECSICLGNFIKPKITPCYHTFCEQCLRGLVEPSKTKFNCPMCREEIDVPVGGVGKFMNDIYVDGDLSEAEEDFYCEDHQEEKLKFFCRDCDRPVCHHCCITGSHKLHSGEDIQQITKEIKTELQSINADFDTQIKENNNVLTSLDENSVNMARCTEEACRNVDLNVKKICNEAKKVGEDLKSKMKLQQQQQEDNIQKTKKEIISFNDKVNIGLDLSDQVCKVDNIIPSLDMIPMIRQTQRECKHINFVIPDVKYPFYNGADIQTELEGLSTILGEYQLMDDPTFSTSININLLKPDLIDLTPDRHTINKLTWYTGVKHHTDKSLGIYLQCNQPDDKTIKSVTADFTIKLVNYKDYEKWRVNQQVYTFKFDQRFGSGWSFTDWTTLKDINNGYLNTNNMFTVQTSVRVTNIERERWW